MTESATAQAQQQREQTPYERFRSYVQNEGFIAQVAPLVGGEAQARTFVRVVLTAVQQTPQLLQADRRSLLLACMKAARDRLMPDGKEAVFNVYNTKVKERGDNGQWIERWVEQAQYLPMVAGLVKKLYASGEVTFVDACAVYEHDEFTYERGDAPRLVHKPFLGDDPGPFVAAYVVVKLKSGEVKREVMPKRDVEKVRAASKAPDGPGWKTWYDQFAIKSVIKRAYKQLPSSVELDALIEHDNEAIGFADFAAGDDQFATSKPAAIAAINKAIEHKPVEPLVPGVVGKAGEPVEAAASETKAAERETKAAKRDTKPTAAATKTAEPPAPSWQEVIDAIHSAKSEDEFALARDLIRSLTDPNERDSAQRHFDERVAANLNRTKLSAK